MTIDPGRIRTRQELTEQLAELFHQGGWSRHRLAEAAGVSPATVQGIVTGSTGVPQAGTLKAFVTACGQQSEPWMQARGRVVQAERAAKNDQASLLGPVNLPFRIQGSFVGRAAELVRLDAALSSPGGVVVQAVHGLGGIGKSTLAVHWATIRLSDHTLTWWITADSPVGIGEGLAGLATALHPEMAGQPLEVLTAQAVQWLTTHSGWLLILDNVTKPADVEPLLARARGGRFLITSRLSVGWHQITSSVVRLDVLQPDEAAALLARILTYDRSSADLDGAGELCTELGHLPLAIEQAAAYMYQARIGPRVYLELLAGYPAVVFDQAAEGSDSERTIARIWRVTLDRLADTPLSGHLLRVLAWCAPDSIPRTLLDGLAAPPRLHQAIGRLAAYNLIATSDDGTLAVHRLVQAVARTPDPGDPHRRSADIQSALHQATRLLHAALPDDLKQPAGWPRWRALLPHITALTDHAPEDTDTLTTAYLLTITGLFLGDQGAPTRAISHHQRALTALARALGGDHRDTLSARNNLAMAYQAAGDLGRAIELYEHAVAEQERILGDDHSNTLASRNNLAQAYQAAGDLGRAIELLGQTLAEQERVLGKDHPSTLNSRNSLALAYRTAGHIERAIPLYEQNLAAQERVLGKDHPDTLAFRTNLIAAYDPMGDVGRAIELSKQTLADCERVLGTDHPHTLVSRNNLARFYRTAGDLVKATELFGQTLVEQERLLGEDHPHTLVSRNNLAAVYQAAGDLGRAIPVYEQNLAALERVLGKDHPHPLSCQSNLAMAYREAGDVGRAIELSTQTLVDCERVLGKDHPYTLQSRHNLAMAYQDTGNVGRAIELSQQALAEHERVLGKDHPHTLVSRNNLAMAYQDAGDAGRAIELSTQTLADCERVLGKDHPDALEARNNLACVYFRTGDLRRAIPLCEQTLVDCERVLGGEHPLTKAVRSNMARLR